MNNDRKMFEFVGQMLSMEYIDPIGFTTKDIEKRMQQHTLRVTNQPRDPFIEEKIQLPIFATLFYYFVAKHQTFPTQAAFIKSYFAMHKDYLEKVIPREKIPALYGRLSRCYPSLVRDFHFYHLLKESDNLNSVLFCLKYDLQAKIDVFINSHEQWFGIQLRTKTQNSNNFYNKKYNRNQLATKARLLDVPIDLNKTLSLPTKGDSIKLYDHRYSAQIIAATEPARTIAV